MPLAAACACPVPSCGHPAFPLLVAGTGVAPPSEGAAGTCAFACACLPDSAAIDTPSPPSHCSHLLRIFQGPLLSSSSCSRSPTSTLIFASTLAFHAAGL
ncbi:hypothetical protein CC79DRAFT_1336633 [Sarocladium strictum]